MGVYSLIPPRILWGPNLDRAIDFGYPLDNVQAGSEPRDGSQVIQAPSGEEDAWTIGTDYLLEGDVRYIPGADVLGPPQQTGWDGTLGWRAFLQSARDKNSFRYYFDSRNLLAFNPSVSGDLDNDGLADAGTVVGGGWIENDAGYGVLSIDGSDGLGYRQKVAVPGGGNSGGSTRFPGIYQRIPGVLPGDSITISSDYRSSALANGANVELICHFRSAADAIISQIKVSDGSNAATWQRFSNSGTAPAGTAQIVFIACLAVPPNTGTTSAGNAWFRYAMVRRNGVTDTTFYDAPYTTSRLVDPMRGTPTPERDGTRAFRMRIRNAANEYAGY